MKKLYQMTIPERIQYIKETYNIEVENRMLDEAVIDAMIENAITTYEIPMGVIENFRVNERLYNVPMVTEEPSVIAALNKGNKMITKYGTMEAFVLAKNLRGQIAFLNPKDPKKLMESVDKEAIIKQGETIYPSIYKRGGGIIDVITYETITEDNHLVVVEIEVDTKEAMGANMVNTLSEGIADYLEALTKETPLMAVLTNYNDTNLAIANCILDMSAIEDGETIGPLIQDASTFSLMNSKRATTHNKGVMNSVEAIVIATGNDTRAISANIHAYASHSGTYKPLTTWKYEAPFLKGTITIPLTIGSVGGSIKSNPNALLSYELLGTTHTEEIMEIIAAAGLIQNLAALYALVSEGIQKGHMNLQLKNACIALGANQKELEILHNRFKNRMFNTLILTRALDALRQETK